MWILDDCRLERDHGQCEPEAGYVSVIVTALEKRTITRLCGGSTRIKKGPGGWKGGLMESRARTSTVSSASCIAIS